jgi:poly-beta-1,6-N-acetyl-D-glucosamine synthase
MMAAIFFWTTFLIIFYSYLGYPLIVALICYFYPFQRARNKYTNPNISVVVSAYNEEAIIATKIKNFISLDYPAQKLELLIGSDGSTDKTNQILSQYRSKRIRTFIYKNRGGKSSVLNRLVREAKGEILVFSDANTIYEKDSIRKLIQHFGDKSIGGVCGKLQLINPNDNTGGKGETLYWDYENKLKYYESKIQTVLGANGAIYALRRELYSPLPEHKVIMDDFVAPLKVVEKGYRVIYEPEAMGVETTSPDMEGEFRRKIRIGAANFNALSEIKSLLNPKKGFVAMGLWSHKIFRWFAPFLLLICFISNIFLMSVPFYRFIFLAQIALYIAALTAFLLNRRGISIKVLGYPFYFCVVNLALAVGFFKFLTKSQKPAWHRVERS